MSYSDRPKNISLSTEIEQLDEKIASLLAQRTRLLAKAAGTRRRKKVSLIDDVQEKNLWHIWEQAFETEGLNKATLKKFFLLLNSLAYARVEKKNDDAGSMCMYPRRQSVEIDIQ
ncbi:MAG: chorismate mutase, partial [Desulfoplanes sp.]|nr:chorismate mutase [Desulfoplanes sp.]